MPKLNLNLNELKEENESSCSDSIYTATDVNSTHNEELPNSRSIAKIGSDKSLASSIKVAPLFKDEDNKRKVNNTQIADDPRSDFGDDGVDIRAHRAAMKLKEAYRTRNNHAETMELLEGENTLE